MSTDFANDRSCTVVCRATPRAGEDRSAAEQIHALAMRLVEEMVGSWRRHQLLRADELLERHPELRQQPEAAVRLIYEEVCLRRERGERVLTAEILERFPQWREHLAGLLDREWRLDPAPTALPPIEPPKGYQVLTELGHGAEGRVYLAIEPALANRPVVLKVTALRGRECLSLARLQHTHIVPLHTVHDDPDHDLRFLCMPYFGGATWLQIFANLACIPPAARSGQTIIEALDRAQPTEATVSGEGPTRRLLARLAFVRAVCWLGATLAEALHYAHERGLVHLDVKPSNVLIAADGAPMLLDFHLAQGPLQPGQAAPSWLGGTPGYMSPEQQRAFTDAERGAPLSVLVDGRSDIYSLGVLLYETLAGCRPDVATPPIPLCRHNPQVSAELSDVIGKCLARQPDERYADAAALAADLCRHADLPDRNWKDEQRQGRHRLRAVGSFVLLLGLIGTLLAVATLIAGRRGELRHAVQTALSEGREELGRSRYAEAARAFNRGLEQADNLRGGEPLAHVLAHQLRAAQRGQKAQELHQFVEGIRSAYVLESLAPRAVRRLEKPCAEMWQARHWLLDRTGGELAPEVEERIRTDLLELAVCWASLRVPLKRDGRNEPARREALLLLDEAEALFGPTPALCRERQLHARALGVAGRGKGEAPRTPWEHYTLGRWLLRQGHLERATAALEKAIAEGPHEFWPNLCLAVCAARRGHQEEAIRAYCVCIGRMPENAECFRLRGEAYAALGRH
ncbi:MAG TPA: serine/threonine-protein kinase, partial [Gemmataceae bacterium]|nr:serine/threonine-protein kinase [Gemmataceae bacterium]